MKCFLTHAIIPLDTVLPWHAVGTRPSSFIFVVCRLFPHVPVETKTLTRKQGHLIVINISVTLQNINANALMQELRIKKLITFGPPGKLPQLTSSRLEKTPGADSLFLKANYGTIDGWYHYEIRVSAGSTLKDINKLTGGNWRFYKTLAGQSIKLSS